MSKKKCGGEIDLLSYKKNKGHQKRWHGKLRQWTCPKCGAIIEMNNRKRLIAIKRKHKRECGKETPFDNWIKDLKGKSDGDNFVMIIDDEEGQGGQDESKG